MNTQKPIRSLLLRAPSIFPTNTMDIKLFPTARTTSIGPTSAKKTSKGFLLPILSLLFLIAALLMLHHWYRREDAVPVSRAAEVLAAEEEKPVLEGPLDLNRATLEELEMLPGIGEILAQRILEYREAHTGFRSIEELTEVSGIGRKKLDRIRDYIYLEETQDENTGG